jgi:O-antigen ligase
MQEATPSDYLRWGVLAAFVVCIVLLGHTRNTFIILVLLASLSYVGYLTLERRRLLSSVMSFLCSPALRWRWLFLVWASVSLFWTAHPGKSLNHVIYMIVIHASCYIVYDAIRYRGQFRTILVLILLVTSAGAISVLGSLSSLPSWFRPRGIYGNPNILAVTSLVGYLVFLFYPQQHQSKLIRLVWHFLGACLLAGAVFSGSRKGLLGIALLWAGSVIFPLSRKRFFTHIGLLIVLLLSGLASIESFQVHFLNAIERLSQIVSLITTSANVDLSLMERSRLFRIGVVLIADSPVLGHGVDSFRWISNSALSSHNNYLETGVSLGVVGLVLYYHVFVRVIRDAYSYLREGDVFPLALMSSLLIVLLDIAFVSNLFKLWILVPVIFAGVIDSVRSKGDDAARS